MIDLGRGSVTPTAPLDRGKAFLARFTSGDAKEPAASRSWVDSLLSEVTAVEACAVVEQLFGVLPLIDSFFAVAGPELKAVTSGRTLGALGLFTPTPEHGWGAVTLAATRAGADVRVSGHIRIPDRHVDGSIVLVRLDETDRRLAWLDHEAAGVERREVNVGGASCDRAPCWIHVDGLTLRSDLVSRPITLVPGAGLHRCLDDYAGVWALVAAVCSRHAVRALRRSVRTTRLPGQPENLCASQLVAMELTDVEIEAELTLTAAERRAAAAAPHRHAGVALALSAARTLAAVAATTRALRDRFDLVVDSPLADDAAAATLLAYLGGPLTLEHEVARGLYPGNTFVPSSAP
jgi:hypothetical protein